MEGEYGKFASMESEQSEGEAGITTNYAYGCYYETGRGLTELMKIFGISAEQLRKRLGDRSRVSG